eukprot:3662276-Rhodomonas_salina.1
MKPERMELVCAAARGVVKPERPQTLTMDEICELGQEIIKSEEAKGAFDPKTLNEDKDGGDDYDYSMERLQEQIEILDSSFLVLPAMAKKFTEAATAKYGFAVKVSIDDMMEYCECEMECVFNS